MMTPELPPQAYLGTGAFGPAADLAEIHVPSGLPSTAVLPWPTALAEEEAENLAAETLAAETLAPPRVATATLRVLHLINGEHYAGAERVQDLLSARLPELGVQVTLACLKPDKFPQLRRHRTAPLVELPMRNRFDLWTAWEASRLLVEGEFDLIHTHTPRTALVGRIAAALAGVPMVHHVHSPTARDTTSFWGNWMNATTERISLAGVAKLICVSESLGQHMLDEGYAPRQVAVVPNGVPVVGPARGDMPPTGTWTLGTVALFRPRKGLEVLLAAVALLREAGWPVRLRAIGGFETPEYEQSIRSEAARLGLDDAIDWTGFTRDVTAELARLDLFVLPSLFGEGLPMVVLEAMGAGVPLVATRVEGVPEAVRDGLDGLLAEPENAADLAAQVARLLRGEVDWRALRASALARQADRFSDASMAAGVAEVYRAVLER